jgi:hypothetical protein
VTTSLGVDDLAERELHLRCLNQAHLRSPANRKIGPNPEETGKRLIGAALAGYPTRRPQQKQQPRHPGLPLPSDPLDDLWQKALVP